MDWFDQYLDGMGEYKVTVSPADTHQWGPAKPSRQQQILMQDAMAFDVQQMRIIQEARQQLERHGSTMAPDPGSPTVQYVPPSGEWNAGASYNVGDIVAYDGANYECTATAGAGYGPFGGFLDGTENGTVYWSAYPIVNSFAYASYPPGGQVDTVAGNIPSNWVANNIDIIQIIMGNSVDTIGSYAFENCSGLTNVTIPDSVTVIEEGAFYNCSLLNNVTIPDGVTVIGSFAFYYCSSLTNVTIPDGVTAIADETFNGCGGLTNVIIPDGVTSIGSRAFSNCTLLNNVIIPDSVTSIGSFAFYNCSLLNNVTIPDSVTVIGNYAFNYCSSLASLSCFAAQTAFDSSQDAFLETGSPLIIHVPTVGAVSDTWTAGPQSFQGNDNVIVIKDL